MTDFLVVSAASAAVCLIAMLVTAYAARRAGRISVVDVTWGLALAAVALVSAVLGEALGEPAPWRRWALLVLVAVWGTRLSWHIWRRNTGHGEDPRYTKLLGSGRGGPLVRVWVPQGAAIWLVSLPVQVSAVAGNGAAVVALLGILVCVVGVTFESVGDAQRAAYKRDPGRGPVMDRGLWRYSRHPNYFGDACAWWGIWLIAAQQWVGALTILSPVLMTWTLTRKTGKPLLEHGMAERRPGYTDYVNRT